MIKPIDAIIFASGLLIGAIGSYVLTKSKLEKKYEDRLETMKDVYGIVQKSDQKVETYIAKDDPEDSAVTEEERKTYIQAVKESGYNTPSNIEKSTKHYVISPDECGECGYEILNMIYTSDGVLIDADDYQKVENIDDLIGEDFMSHFGEYEDDSVHIRNDERKCDYEIVYNMKAFDEFKERRPPVIWRQNE